MISYEDGIAALEWLCRAFGFRETARLTTPDGKLSHGEMQAGKGLIMLALPTPEYRGPKHHREICEQARKWSTVPWIIDGVLVYVDPNAVGKLIPEMNVAPSWKMSVMPGVVG